MDFSFFKAKSQQNIAISIIYLLSGEQGMGQNIVVVEKHR
jgi:uncharacterized membrane protein